MSDEKRSNSTTSHTSFQFGEVKIGEFALGGFSLRNLFAGETQGENTSAGQRQSALDGTGTVSHVSPHEMSPNGFPNDADQPHAADQTGISRVNGDMRKDSFFSGVSKLNPFTFGARQPHNTFQTEQNGHCLKNQMLGFWSSHRTSLALSLFGVGLAIGIVSTFSALSRAPIASVSDDILAQHPYTLRTELRRLATDSDKQSEQQVAAADLQQTGAPKTIEDLLDDSEAAQTDANAAPIKTVEPFVTKTATVKRGDTLSTVLARSGLTNVDIHRVASALAQNFNPRHLRAGQDIELTFQNIPHATPEIVTASLTSPIGLNLFDFGKEEDEFEPQLTALEIKTAVDRSVRVERTDLNNFESQEIIAELGEGFMRAYGTINSSLYVSAQKQGVPGAVIAELIRMHSYDVDFQREIRQGDTFEVFYKEYTDDDGNAVKSGDVLFGSLTLRGKRFAYYRYVTPDDNEVDYYDENGQSAKKFLMKTPVDGARISSVFGMRKHPILGYTKKHTGIDFAARSGTPIMAAGSGTVIKAGVNGGYGNYVLIRHANSYRTAYAHMKSFAKGTRVGAKVKQGQIIGYVGTTGRSTGPHLHYEVHRDGTKINPSSVKALTGRKLNGDLLQAFNAERSKLELRMAEYPVGKPVVTAKADNTNG